MSWRTINFDWNQVKAFLVAAEEGSLSAAARALGSTQPTLSRQVSSLEKTLGVSLFDRDERGLTLTASGRELLNYVRNMAFAAAQFSESAAGTIEQIEGVVNIAAAEAMAVYGLPSLVAKIREQEPKLILNIMDSSHLTNIKKRDADLGIRYSMQNSEELTYHRLKDEEVYLYASRSYINELNLKQNPLNIINADFIGFEDSNNLIQRLGEIGVNLTEKNFPILARNQVIHWQMVQQGLGIAVLPNYVGDRDPLVQRVFPERGPILIPTWLVANKEAMLAKKIRYVHSLIVETFG